MSGLPLKMKRNLKSSIDLCEDDLLKRIEKKDIFNKIYSRSFCNIATDR